MVEFLNKHNGKKYDDYFVYGNISTSNDHSRDVVTHLGFKSNDGKTYSIKISELRLKYLKNEK